MNKPTIAKTIDKKKTKKSNKEIELREKAETSLQVTDKLKCPKDMTEESQKIWRGLMKLYKQMDAKILCDLDKHSLRMYCETYALYLKTQAEIESMIGTSPTIFLDKQFQSLIRTMNKQCEVCTNLAEKLCLTPIGRARMGIASAKMSLKEEKTLDDFFSKFDESEESEEEAEEQNIEDFFEDEEK